MHTTTSTAHAHPHHAASQPSPSSRFRTSMSMTALVLFGLAYMVPLAVFSAYGLVAQTTRGHLPSAYLLTLLAMLFTAFSYGRMVQAHPYSGSVYTYIRKTFGAHLGFMTGWTLLLDYIFLPLLSYLLIGIYMSEYFPAIHAWVWVLGSIALVTFLNLIGIESVTRVNWIMVVAQLVFIVVFVALSIRVVSDQPEPVSLLSPFYHEGFSLPLVMTGAAVLCLSFVGFDAVSTMAEETANPTSRIPAAIMAVSLIGGLLFLVVSYFAQLVHPAWNSFVDPDSAPVEVMRSAGGQMLASAFIATYVAGCFASAMAAQASVSRVLFAMGRDGALPRRLGQLVTKKRVPANAIMLVGLVSLIALVISLDTVANMISFGALCAFSAVNLAVVKHYLVDRKLRGARNCLLYGVIPGLGFLSTLWLWTSLSSLSLDIGLGWMGLGVLWLFGMTRAFRVKLPDLQMAD
ncbi:APC family permease [Pseudomonas vanderleydeniana]|uniref:APC family permease n=1 Tax=Pseudomonas vanderleydeniana TaxID=2745495 RepID=A0A9E6PF07_9PSED|nr:APC family permease [Pseudomonas vanderleydeniana]QXI25627.1 APC family permease [Pseudomonas vanderleydeniana]